MPAPTTTSFRNTYHGGARRAAPAGVCRALGLADVPADWLAARVIHLAPVAREVDLALADALAAPGRLVAATPQGWLRQWDAAGLVAAAAGGDLPGRLSRVDAVALSEEDAVAEPGAAARLAAAGPLVALTRGAQGVRLLHGAEAWDWPAPPPGRAILPALATCSPRCGLAAWQSATMPWRRGATRRARRPASSSGLAWQVCRPPRRSRSDWRVGQCNRHCQSKGRRGKDHDGRPRGRLSGLVAPYCWSTATRRRTPQAGSGRTRAR